MTVSIAEIVAAARQGEASLVCESAGYIVLGLADALSRSPRLVGPADAGIDENGDVGCMSGAPLTSEEIAERCIRRLLGWLLREARTTSPNLSRVAERKSSAGLAHLVVELEAALVPVNRKAARRSLARLWRETTRAVSQGVVAVTDFEAQSVAPASVGLIQSEHRAGVVERGGLPSAAWSAPSVSSEALAAPAAVCSQAAPNGAAPVPLDAPLTRAEVLDVRPEEEELDVLVDVELPPFELSAVAPRVAQVPDLEPVVSAETSRREAAARRTLDAMALAFIDTTPTHVMPRVAARVAQREAEPQLNLHAPTPVSAVASTPVGVELLTETYVATPFSEPELTVEASAESSESHHELLASVDSPEPRYETLASAESLERNDEPLASVESPEPRHETLEPSAEPVGAAWSEPESNFELAPALEPSPLPPALEELPHSSPSESPHRPSDVNDLLARFAGPQRRPDHELLRGLERLAGVDARSPSRLESELDDGRATRSSFAVR